ncbi:hypothetical protein Tco_0642165 [Tanacetum coccineum]
MVKPGGGIRPIVVGRVWRHLVSKVGAIMIGHSLDRYLDGLQFGVGVSGGGEAILHAVNRLIEGRRDDVGLSMLLVDFKMIVVVRGYVTRSSSLLSRYLTLGGNHVTLTQLDYIKGNIPYGHAKGCIRAWYLDDGTIVGDTFVGDTLLEASEDDDDILDNLSLDSRFYAKKVIRGLKIRSSVKSFVRQKKPPTSPLYHPAPLQPAGWMLLPAG